VTSWLLIVLHAVLGGQPLARARLSCDARGAALAGSPFPDFRVPGLFLTFVIGGTNLMAAVLVWRQHPGSPLASVATGLLLVAWVAIQAEIIGFRH
jgi:hypothetical protein